MTGTDSTITPPRAQNEPRTLPGEARATSNEPAKFSEFLTLALEKNASR